MIRTIGLFLLEPIFRVTKLQEKAGSCSKNLIFRFRSTFDSSNLTNQREKFVSFGCNVFCNKDILQIIFLINKVYMPYLCSGACFSFQKCQC